MSSVSAGPSLSRGSVQASRQTRRAVLQAAFCRCHAKESPRALPFDDRERWAMFRETGGWKELLRKALEMWG